MKKIRTHYDNLQVVETASLEVIKGAYRYLSQKWHPDKNPHQREEATRILAILNAAYEVLSDPQRRKEHDAWIAVQRKAREEAKPSPAGKNPRSTDTHDQSPRFFRDALKTGGYGPEMVWIPGGTFTMGSPASEPERSSDEGPQHRVTVPAFALGRTEVRFADYDRFAEATGRAKPKDRWGRGEQPVIHVSWFDAQAYADWLSEQTGQRYRLPSEAEWEYAARAGTTTPFWTGDCINTDQANYDGTHDYAGRGAKTGRYRKQTVAVGSLPANAFGLHEMAGNVYEWTEDCWHDSYAGAPTDGSAWRETNDGDCARRVLRGGSWYFKPQFLRSANRDGYTAGVALGYVGIRLARTP